MAERAKFTYLSVCLSVTRRYSVATAKRIASWNFFHCRVATPSGLYSAWACLCAGWNEYLAKAGRVNRHIAWHIHQPVTVVAQCSLIAWLNGLASGDQRRLMGSGSALEACSRRWAIRYKWPRLLSLLTFTSTSSLQRRIGVANFQKQHDFWPTLYTHVGNDLQQCVAVSVMTKWCLVNVALASPAAAASISAVDWLPVTYCNINHPPSAFVHTSSWCYHTDVHVWTVLSTVFLSRSLSVSGWRFGVSRWPRSTQLHHARPG